MTPEGEIMVRRIRHLYPLGPVAEALAALEAERRKLLADLELAAVVFFDDLEEELPESAAVRMMRRTLLEYRPATREGDA